MLLTSLRPAEIADLLESFPHGPREILWELVDTRDHGKTLVHVNDEVRAGLIGEMATRDLVAATAGLDTDDLADVCSRTCQGPLSRKSCVPWTCRTGNGWRRSCTTRKTAPAA